ncbi:DUF4177 domain-containing protein [Portibacter lacus]|uniref:DUF4177 domain-containing protein n=1 Tax=Portibacter lacus TaxID=1099794 RepID=A0AA37SL77_9BACT|nr:DUF4177 domain-containing protein [Portibacter lacus]GLR16037.1 hypothetical protein GCM10007940_06520 [Portibacter lacus]
MKKYEYKAILIKIDMVWSGRAESDYLEALNENGKEGWEFVEFIPKVLQPKGVKGQEILLKRELPEY